MAEKTPRVATIAHISHKHALAAAVATIIEQQRNPPMTKPSREDFEQELAAHLERKWLPPGTPSPNYEIVAEALRIAADQMTEREKVVAFLRADAIEVLKDGLEDYGQALLDAAHAIEAGDHSTATPVSPPGGGT